MKFSRLFIVLPLLGLLALAFWVDWLFTEPQALPLLTDGKLTDAKAKAIDIITSRSNLIANWNIGTIGACAYLVVNENNFSKRRLDLVLIALSVFTALASVFFAQALLDILARTLINEQDVAHNENLFASIFIQYIATMFSILFFLIAACSIKFGRYEDD